MSTLYVAKKNIQNLHGSKDKHDIKWILKKKGEAWPVIFALKNKVCTMYREKE